MIVPIKESYDYLVFHVRKERYLYKKQRHSVLIALFTLAMLFIYILISTGALPPNYVTLCDYKEHPEH